jgi:hypothetical protein
MEKRQQFFNNCCWENWISAYRKLKLKPCLLPCTNINSKWIKDLDIRPDIFNLVWERKVNTLEATSIGNDFLRNSIGSQLGERINKWDCIKMKSFCRTKEMVSKLKRPSTEREKIFASYTLDKGWITRKYRELKKLNSHKINDPIKKWRNRQMNWTEPFQKKKSKWLKKHMKKCSPSLAIKEMQMKTTLRFHFTPVRIAWTTNVGEDVGKRNPHTLLMGM